MQKILESVWLITVIDLHHVHGSVSNVCQHIHPPHCAQINNRGKSLRVIIIVCRGGAWNPHAQRRKRKGSWRAKALPLFLQEQSKVNIEELRAVKALQSYCLFIMQIKAEDFKRNSNNVTTPHISYRSNDFSIFCFCPFKSFCFSYRLFRSLHSSFTEMGIDRIKRNLKIDTTDVVEYCKNKVLDKNCNIYKQGKNWYCEVENIIVFINQIIAFYVANISFI